MPRSACRSARPSRPSRGLRAAGSLALVLGLVALACGDAVPVLTVSSPAHGTFTTATSIAVTGTATNVPAAELELTVNGVVTAIQPGGSKRDDEVIAAADAAASLGAKKYAADLLASVTKRVPPGALEDHLDVLPLVRHVGAYAVHQQRPYPFNLTVGCAPQSLDEGVRGA